MILMLLDCQISVEFIEILFLFSLFYIMTFLLSRLYKDLYIISDVGFIQCRWCELNQCHYSCSVIA